MSLTRAFFILLCKILLRVGGGAELCSTPLVKFVMGDLRIYSHKKTRFLFRERVVCKSLCINDFYTSRGVPFWFNLSLIGEILIHPWNCFSIVIVVSISSRYSDDGATDLPSIESVPLSVIGLDMVNLFFMVSRES